MSSSVSDLSLSSLANRHFWLHWFIGVIISAVIIYAGVIGIGKPIQNPDLFGYVIFFPFLFFGIPAAVVGKLRTPTMQRLFTKARHQPEKWLTGRLLRWTCLIFLVPVLSLSVCIGIWLLYKTNEGGAAILMPLLTIAISIPWLIGATVATYLIRDQIWGLEQHLPFPEQ